jgi:hypothetical protein
MNQTPQSPTNTLGHDWDSLLWLDGLFQQQRLEAAGTLQQPIQGLSDSLRDLVHASEAATRSIQWPNARVHELRCRARAAGLRWLGKYGRRDELRAALLVLNMGSACVDY